MRRTTPKLCRSLCAGVSINITVAFRLLTLTVSVTRNMSGMQGLLGNMNGNPEDDYVFPNGTVLPNDTSERDLLAYGKTCESMFWLVWIYF